MGLVTGWDAILDMNIDGWMGVEDDDDRKVRGERERWSVKMRGFQSDARVQLSSRLISREEVTALVKESHPDIAR